RRGVSAKASGRRLRAEWWASWIRTLPWRVAAALGIGAGGGVLGHLLAPRLGLIVAALVAIAAGVGVGGERRPGAGRCVSRPAGARSPGGEGPRGSGALPASFASWSGAAGRSCTTWLSPAAGPTSTTWGSGPG